MWAYEARRIFRDRLVGDKACDKFENILTSVLQTDWSVDLASSEAEGVFYVTWGHSPSATDLSSSFGQQLGRLAAADMEEIVAKAIISYGTCYTVTVSMLLLSYSLNVVTQLQSQCCYSVTVSQSHTVTVSMLLLSYSLTVSHSYSLNVVTQIQSHSLTQLQSQCYTCVCDVYSGREHIELDIFLFHEVLDHMSRVDRVLTCPGGSLLLSGQSGVGRRTAVKLVAHMHHLELVTPHISRSYTLKHFKNDLKTVSWSFTAYMQYINTYMYIPTYINCRDMFQSHPYHCQCNLR